MLRILVPEPNATLRANDRQLIVTVSSESAVCRPPLPLILDGELVGDPSRSPVFP